MVGEEGDGPVSRIRMARKPRRTSTCAADTVDRAAGSKTFKFLHTALSTNPTDLESTSFIRLIVHPRSWIKAGLAAFFFSVPLPPFLITLLPCCKLYTLSIPTLALLSLVTQTPLAHFLSSLFPAVQNAFHDDLRYACECASAGFSRHESPSGYYNHGGPVRKFQHRRSFTAVAGSLGCRQRRRLDESVHPVLQSAAIRHPNEQQRWHGRHHGD
ncbi:hypothetical protein PGT21_036853 [Puccinia graminis f. sp. tritici]|uniref:Uncharacterized protein n=1 Tax=Puccinia graminis f. sp. tritici TaxID=56615 RepID=A0A5B0QDW3_PUCGR|nr:hypothetical protein PGT21_036853 [Puccinia graminis f. sp. tritici]